MADGGGSPRCGFDILSSLARSEITGVSAFGLGGTRGLGSDGRGEKSWVLLGGCERVSNIGARGQTVV